MSIDRSRIPYDATLVVMPAYNEAETISKVLNQIDPRYDVLVVDDASQDDTAAVAKQHDCVVMSHPFNMGSGGAIRTGCKYAVRNEYEYVVTIDADGQHPPDSIEDVLTPVCLEGVDLCIGSRFRGEAVYDVSLVRYVGIVVYSRTVTMLSDAEITDCTSGFRAFTAELAAAYQRQMMDGVWAVEITLWTARHGYDVAEVPVTMADRETGESYLNAVRLALYPLRMVYAIPRSL